MGERKGFRSRLDRMIFASLSDKRVVFDQKSIVNSKETSSIDDLFRNALDVGSDLRFGDWADLDFTGCDLSGFDFTGADLTGCSFAKALIRHARFDQATVKRSDLQRANDWIGHIADWSPPNEIPSGGSIPDFSRFSDAPFAPEMVALARGQFDFGVDADSEEFRALLRSRRGSERKPPSQLSEDALAEWRRNSYDAEQQQGVFIERRFAISLYPVSELEYSMFDAAGNAPSNKSQEFFPVTGISVSDARFYCDWLTLRTGVSYRLPSEVEWEYAARGGSSALFPWGNSFDCDSIPSGAAVYGGHARLGSVPPNGFGLYDVVGNVSQFCEDDWEERATAPRSQAPYRSKEEFDRSAKRVPVRGGSNENPIHRLHVAYRNWAPTGDPGGDDIGFRVVRDLP